MQVPRPLHSRLFVPRGQVLPKTQAPAKNYCFGFAKYQAYEQRCTFLTYLHAHQGWQCQTSSGKLLCKTDQQYLKQEKSTRHIAFPLQVETISFHCARGSSFCQECSVWHFEGQSKAMREAAIHSQEACSLSLSLWSTNDKKSKSKLENRMEQSPVWQAFPENPEIHTQLPPTQVPRPLHTRLLLPLGQFAAALRPN